MRGEPGQPGQQRQSPSSTFLDRLGRADIAHRILFGEGRVESVPVLFRAMNEPEIPIIESKPTGNPRKGSSGVGMPAGLYLQMFGDMLFRAYGEVPYQVGSSLFGEKWRDVDVRVILDDEAYAAMGFGDPNTPQENERWCLLTMAISLLGQKMTGLPIDFQFQQITDANNKWGGDEHPRSALILGTLRRQRANKQPAG
jgi:hypothetical protein